jgi:hypothetical protein
MILDNVFSASCKFRASISLLVVVSFSCAMAVFLIGTDRLNIYNTTCGLRVTWHGFIWHGLRVTRTIKWVFSRYKPPVASARNEYRIV